MTTSRQKSNIGIKAALFPILLILIIIIGSLYFVKSQMDASPGTNFSRPKVGDVLPDFKVKPVGKEPVKLSEFHAKLILLNFWATWCEACMVEMPSLVKLRDHYNSEGFEILGINLDANPEFVVPRVKKEFNISFPLFEDPEGSVVDLFNIQAIPVTVILDSKRKVLYIQDGERDWNSGEVRKKIEQWLSE